jgi:DNA-directed RNA polymerase subunit RPC12/RpoP
MSDNKDNKNVEVRCAICGKSEVLNKVHKDYQKVSANPGAVYICVTCNAKLSHQASRENDLMKNK